MHTSLNQNDTGYYGGRESSTRCNFLNLTTHTLQMLTTHPKKKRNALQIEKNTCKLRKHFRQFDNTHAANAHNTTTKRNALQIEKNTCKLRKHFRQFDNTHAANAHNTTTKRNVLQIEKNTCKLRKHFRQFDNAHAANAHNTTKKETRCK